MTQQRQRRARWTTRIGVDRRSSSGALRSDHAPARDIANSLRERLMQILANFARGERAIPRRPAARGLPEIPTVGVCKSVLGPCRESPSSSRCVVASLLAGSFPARRNRMPPESSRNGRPRSADAPKLSRCARVEAGYDGRRHRHWRRSDGDGAGKWLGSGRVYATDITQRALQTTREYAEAKG